jgi:hypothetical protein
MCIGHPCTYVHSCDETTFLNKGTNVRRRLNFFNGLFHEIFSVLFYLHGLVKV